MTTAREAWIIDGVRSPRGKGKPTGALHGIHPQELLAQCLNALVTRTGVEPSAVEDVITAPKLSALYGTPIEVLRAGDGRLVVVGQPEAPHYHGHRHE